MNASLADVRALLEDELKGAVGGKALVKRCTSLALALQSSNTADAPVPHLVWHYLSDADIRIRDPKYAAAQLAETEAVLLGGHSK